MDVAYRNTVCTRVATLVNSLSAQPLSIPPEPRVVERIRDVPRPFAVCVQHYEFAALGLAVGILLSLLLQTYVHKLQSFTSFRLPHFNFPCWSFRGYS